MSVSSASRISTQGELSSTSVVEVLKTLEQQRVTGRIRLGAEIGEAEIDLVGGGIVGARMDGLTGVDALFRLLGLVDGHYEVRHEPVEARPQLVESVVQLVSDRTQRMQEWRRLSEQAPAFSSVLRLSTSGIESLKGQGLTAHQVRLLSIVDGRHTIAEILDQSGLDAVVALRALIEAIRDELLIEGQVEHSLFPVSGHRSDESFEVALPPPAAVPKLKDSGAPSPSGIALRKTTVIGIGIPTPIPPRVPATEVRRIISIERSDSSGPPPAAGSSSVPPTTASAAASLPQNAVSVSSSRPPATAGAYSSAPPPPVRASETPVVPLDRTLVMPKGPPADAAPAAEVAAAADASAEIPKAGRYVGRYEVLCRIGRGGMGSVYLCRVTSEGGFRRLFALKLLRSDLPRVGGAAATRFLDEARLAGYIHHPNVVSVVDAGMHGSNPYLVMDYVEGASLKQLLSARPGSRPAELILPIILDALAGLHAAHSMVGDDGKSLGIVHCDVSPENLMVGIDGVCRLTDFGVARHAMTAHGQSRITHGKPGYLAPEQVLGNRVDPRTDVFALGVVLYNALTGSRLFEAATLEETLRQVCTFRIDPPSTVGLRPPPSLDFACMKALERDASRRYESAEQMMMELRRIALRENLLSPASEVAAWVRDSVGRELVQRRLSVLDASRGLGASGSDPISSPPESAGEPRSPGANADEPPPSFQRSQTIVLPPESSPHRRIALIVASILAGAAIIATMLWPDLISRAFRMNTEGVPPKSLELPPVPSSQGPLPAPSVAPPANTTRLSPAQSGRP